MNNVKTQDEQDKFNHIDAENPNAVHYIVALTASQIGALHAAALSQLPSNHSKQLREAIEDQLRGAISGGAGI